MDKLSSLKLDNKDQNLAVEILKDVLKEPFRTILNNGGLDSKMIEKTVYESLNPNFGYDSNKEVYVNMIEDGIIDPTKVTKTAIQNAISIVGTMLTTECSIIDDGYSMDPMAGLGGLGGMGLM